LWTELDLLLLELAAGVQLVEAVLSALAPLPVVEPVGLDGDKALAMVDKVGFGEDLDRVDSEDHLARLDIAAHIEVLEDADKVELEADLDTAGSEVLLELDTVNIAVPVDAGKVELAVGLDKVDFEGRRERRIDKIDWAVVGRRSDSLVDSFGSAEGSLGNVDRIAADTLAAAGDFVVAAADLLDSALVLEHFLASHG